MESFAEERRKIDTALPLSAIRFCVLAESCVVGDKGREGGTGRRGSRESVRARAPTRAYDRWPQAKTSRMMIDRG